jgi:hypothetical protein
MNQPPTLQAETKQRFAVRVLRQDRPELPSYWQTFSLEYESEMNVTSVLQRIARLSRTESGQSAVSRTSSGSVRPKLHRGSCDEPGRLDEFAPHGGNDRRSESRGADFRGGHSELREGCELPSGLSSEDTADEVLGAGRPSGYAPCHQDFLRRLERTGEVVPFSRTVQSLAPSDMG